MESVQNVGTILFLKRRGNFSTYVKIHDHPTRLKREKRQENVVYGDYKFSFEEGQED